MGSGAQVLICAGVLYPRGLTTKKNKGKKVVAKEKEVVQVDNDVSLASMGML